ncbi:MAG: hypothetical protein KIT56_06870 [Gammaproteobacteria bacterium]|nr:hypothetical protein [Gammaproteobacteria bacterium]
MSDMVNELIQDENDLLNSFAEIFEIRNHVRARLALNKHCNPSMYTSWGPEAVIIDAWLGEVYPACDILNKLFDCDQFHIQHNGTKKYAYLVPFNP